MNFIEVALFILFLAIVSVPIATRFRIPLEVFLVIGSSIISLLPGLPSFEIRPMIVFYIFLPPILFSAAYFTSWRDFKTNIRPIVLLAFGLVICTACAVAFTATLFLPGFTWQEGFLLGAIVSPSDISAAAAILKKLGAPRRFVAILEGESLINDATALILFRFSLASIVLGSFSLPQAISEFAIISAGGLAVGLIISVIGVYLIQKINDVQAETTLTFVIAFTSYLIAERLGVSGVISTVASGIYFGIQFPESAATQTRLNAKSSWRTLLFIINCFAFTLLGLVLPNIAQSLWAYRTIDLILYGASVSLVVIGMRLLWVLPAVLFPQLIFSRQSRAAAPINPYLVLGVGWMGMRGIVSLAAVLAIPYQIVSGVPFPHRDLMIFITYCVIAVTLIPPALTLPYVLRYLNLSDADNRMHEEALARVGAAKNILHTIEETAEINNIPKNILDDFRRQIEQKLNVIKTQLSPTPYSSLTNEYIAVKKLSLAAIASERETLIQLRRAGVIHDEIFRLLTDELDLEELRANTLRL